MVPLMIKKEEPDFPVPLGNTDIFLLEVTVQPAFQTAAVTGLVTSHLVDGVVDGIQAVLLCAGGQVELALGCAELAVRESVRSGHFFTPKSAMPIFCAIGKNAPNDATLWR